MARPKRSDSMGEFIGTAAFMAMAIEAKMKEAPPGFVFDVSSLLTGAGYKESTSHSLTSMYRSGKLRLSDIAVVASICKSTGVGILTAIKVLAKDAGGKRKRRTVNGKGSNV